MYGKINSFWENFHRVKLKTQANLLNYHYNIVSNIVNSYSGSIYQIQEDSFIALWNYPVDVEEYEKKYTGGDFKLFNHEIYTVDKFKNSGSVLMFKPYINHCVTPIISGERKTFTIFIYGSKWK